MLAIELPSELRITTKKTEDTICCAGFLFNKFGDIKTLRVKHTKQISSGVLMTGALQPNVNLAVIVSREGSNTLGLNLYNLLTRKLAKRRTIHTQTIPTNSRIVLRSHFEAKRILFYFESQGTIEIRNSISLKIVSTFSLAEICDSLNMSNDFSELKASVDFDYIPHMSNVVILLDSKIVLVQAKKTTPTILFDNENEKFHRFSYNPNQWILLAEGISSLLLIDFDEFGARSIRLLTSNTLGRSCKLLCWNPFEEIIVVSQRIARKRENFHILSYKTESLTVAASVLDVQTYGNYYNKDSQSLIFIEGNEQLQMMSCLSLKDFNKNIEGVEQPAILEGECMAYLPKTDHQHDSYNLYEFNGIIAVKPQFSSDKVYLR